MALAVVVGLGVAVARNDDGSKTFFLQGAPTFGQAKATPARPGPSRDEGRSVTINLHQKQRDGARAVRVARAQPRSPDRLRGVEAKAVIRHVSGPVTLMTDATLQRGDAVMTMHGIRIFTGAAAFPHRETDFVALNGVGGLSRSVAKILLAMDSRPRG